MYEGSENPAAIGEPGDAAGLPKDRSSEAQLPTQYRAVSVAAQLKAPPLPGLIGSVRDFILDAAPHPNADIALAGSIALMAGITGRAYNTYTGAGLNQYILLMASTGLGKEAAASGISKLLAAITPTVPAAGDFKGPALVSSAGLVKWLDKKPSVVSIIGEFGYKLKAISSPKANPNDELLKATLLDIYGKSGAGNVLDPMAYSDRDKQTAPIHSPALTLLGESVPGVVYEALNESMVLSGLLPRFMVIEATGQRSPLNETPATEPCPQLMQSLADLCAHVLAINYGNRVEVVHADADAKLKFREFGQWVTDQINGEQSETLRELWNRAHLKALKVASLCAVGINPFAPVVTVNETMWATNMIVGQVNALIAKFAKGETGEVAGDEVKQQRAIMRAITEYVTGPYSRWESYHGSAEMHREGVVTLPHIMQRLRGTAAFKHDRLGATKAIERTIKLLLDGDQLREIPAAQMIARYGSKPRAYAVSDPASFLASLTD